MSKPVAVCISDLHFNISTIALASTALKLAILKAESLNIPLVIAGDLNDTKAIIRAEVANRLITLIKNTYIKVYIIVGNHDLVHEKGKENGLNYLEQYADIINTLTYVDGIGYLLAYQSDKEDVERVLSSIPKGSQIIMHQGVLGAHMGDYIVDRSSIDTDKLKDYKVISGHYHRHQTIGTVTYIGSPYTITFGEANDGPKGFLVLNDDGTFDREILSLRKHIKLEVDVDTKFTPILGINPEDKLHLKVTGSFSKLQKLKKTDIGMVLLGHNNFQLDLVPTDRNMTDTLDEKKTITDDQRLLGLIDSLEDTAEQKAYLKELYYEIIKS